MDQLKPILAPIITEKCFDKFLVDFDFLDEPCLKHTLSKGLGVGIIAGSVLVKVPQILKIMSNRSAAGITFLSQAMELFAISATLSYSYCSGFPFSAWGEACFLAIQTAIVASLVLLYGYGSALLALSFVVGYGASLYALISDYTPLDILWSMQAANVPIIVISKMIQAVTNYRNQSTGQLSAITVFLLFLGSVARIFTSIQETGDRIVITTYVVSSCVNALIAFQMLWYWKSTIKDGHKKKTPAKAGGKGGKNGSAVASKKANAKLKKK
ncbi:unnamed protein product [Allacma fusca]|uniref:Mannose-P-dolichol utilization defect 1 protein homolog n=1 Tax=Allacma fusca TaxID=39272 RepID=A0A8J2J0J7_9HEXA|nr:unnamed protein product [Allacma fusca]